MRFLAVLLAALTAVNPVWAQAKASYQQSEAGPQPTLRVRVVDDPGLTLPNSTSLKGYAIQVTDSSGAPIADAAVALRLPEEGATGHFGEGLRAWVAYTDPAGLARFPIIQWEGSVGLAELRLTAAKGATHAGLLVQQQVGSEKLRSLVLPATATAKAPPVALPPAPEIAIETPQPSPALADTLPMPTSNSGATIPKESEHTLTPDLSSTVQTHASAPEPTVSITSSGSGAGHGGRKKWLIIAAVGAAAGVGAVLALKGHAGGATTSSSGVSIGTPTISVSH
jgi:hypothetical protein